MDKTTVSEDGMTLETKGSKHTNPFAEQEKKAFEDAQFIVRVVKYRWQVDKWFSGETKSIYVNADFVEITTSGILTFYMLTSDDRIVVYATPEWLEVYLVDDDGQSHYVELR